MGSEANGEELFKAIHDAVVTFEEEECKALCSKVVEEGLDAYEAITRGLAAGMATVGRLYQDGEYFVPELLLCSDALYAGLDILKPHIRIQAGIVKGKLLIGVVEGDIHDIGKSLVKTMFEAAGWDVHDLGKDVKVDLFLQAQREVNPDVVALSALMTTSMQAMPRVIEGLKAQNGNVKVMVGGAPLNAEIARQYGADGYARDAVTAVKEATTLLNSARPEG